uniref:Uncharacterized protein n=1 Tax=Podoviridae sp. ct8Lf7 TaxID=2827723 RepID=A0A8S5S0S0_9CAUD|nr:MAG TPA: hypothetical protein [Podoviridae sp. ct8Lf7]
MLDQLGNSNQPLNRLIKLINYGNRFKFSNSNNY